MPFGLEALTAVPQVALGAYEAFQGARGLKNLAGQPMPEYSMSPEFQNYYNMTKDRSAYGFDPSETANFKQNVAQQQNTGFRQGVQMAGGNLAGALNAGFKAQNLTSMNQFAAQDAQQHRANISQYGGAAGEMMGQENLINQEKIRHRTQLEQAYGGALKAGLGNITSGLMSGAGLGFMGQQNNQQGAGQNYYGGGGYMSPNLYGSGSFNNFNTGGTNSLNMNPQPNFNMQANQTPFTY